MGFSAPFLKYKSRYLKMFILCEKNTKQNIMKILCLKIKYNVGTFF